VKRQCGKGKGRRSSADATRERQGEKFSSCGAFFGCHSLAPGKEVANLVRYFAHNNNDSTISSFKEKCKSNTSIF